MIWKTVSFFTFETQLHFTMTLYGLVCYTDRFGSKAFLRSQKTQAQILYFLLMYLTVVFLPAVTLVQAYFLHQNWQFGSFVYHPILYLFPEQKIIAFGIGVLFDGWFIFYIWGAMFITLQINLSFMFTVKTTIVKMMEITGKKQTSISDLQQIMAIYSQLRIITTFYNNLFGKLFVPGLKSMMGIMLVQNVFVSVRLAGRGGWIVLVFGVSCSLCIVAMMMIFVGFNAMVNDYSKRFGTYLNKHNKFCGRFGTKLIKSYKEIAVTSGGMYIIEKKTCLTVLAMISNICGSILISVKI